MTERRRSFEKLTVEVLSEEEIDSRSSTILVSSLFSAGFFLEALLVCFFLATPSITKKLARILGGVGKKAEC